MNRVSALWLVTVCAGCHGGAGSHSPSELAKATALAQLRALEWSQGVTAWDSLRLTEVRVPGEPTLRLFNVGVSPGHPRPGVLVLVVGDTAVPLGGFSSPDVSRASELLGVRHEPAKLLSVARILAMCLDLNGGRRVVYPFGSREPRDSVSGHWLAAEGHSSPDTVSRRADGGTFVSVEVLSRARAAYLWQPLRYVFDFDRDGHLLAWYRNSAEEGFIFSDGSLFDDQSQ